MTAATSNSQVHPMFRAALATFGNQGQLQQIQRAAYVKALKAHDWSFEFSDDDAKYTRGRESLAQLKLAQRELDPLFTVWNEHAPESHRRGEVERLRDGGLL